MIIQKNIVRVWSDGYALEGSRISRPMLDGPTASSVLQGRQEMIEQADAEGLPLIAVSSFPSTPITWEIQSTILQ